MATIKKTVFVAHPIAGDIRGNVKEVMNICRAIHSESIIPVAPYLVSLQYLNDEVKEDRALGIAANLECFHRHFIDELWIFGDRISSGMQQEINLALELGIPVIPQTETVREDFDNKYK